MKNTFSVVDVLIIFVLGMLFGYLALSLTSKPSTPQEAMIVEPNVTPQVIKTKMIEVQKMAGCKILDGKCGAEMIRIINPIIDKANELEERELFDYYAAPHILAPERDIADLQADINKVTENEKCLKSTE